MTGMVQICDDGDHDDSKCKGGADAMVTPATTMMTVMKETTTITITTTTTTNATITITMEKRDSVKSNYKDNNEYACTKHSCTKLHTYMLPYRIVAREVTVRYLSAGAAGQVDGTAVLHSCM